ncbi:hypothetical protein JKG47_06125 [Acidithiobacillus sp. MC6.1]|nr:hypothetical protein [Acidithiobacillus sp. MC6.1]
MDFRSQIMEHRAIKNRPRRHGSGFPREPGRDRKRRPYTIGKVWQQAMQRAGMEGLR